MPHLIGNCLTCGYPLVRLASARCPECGTPFDPADPATMRFHKSRLPRFLSKPNSLLTFVPFMLAAALFIGVELSRPGTTHAAGAAMLALITGMLTLWIVLARRRFRQFMKLRNKLRAELEKKLQKPAM